MTFFFFYVVRYSYKAQVQVLYLYEDTVLSSNISSLGSVSLLWLLTVRIGFQCCYVEIYLVDIMSTTTNHPGPRSDSSDTLPTRSPKHSFKKWLACSCSTFLSMRIPSILSILALSLPYYSVCSTVQTIHLGSIGTCHSEVKIPETVKRRDWTKANFRAVVGPRLIRGARDRGRSGSE